MIFPSTSEARERFARLLAGAKHNFSEEAQEILCDYADYSDIEFEDFEKEVAEVCEDFVEASDAEVRAKHSVPEGATVEDFLDSNTILVGVTEAGTYVYAEMSWFNLKRAEV